MARKLRVEFEGAVYHVMNRGDQRERIFVDDEDRRLFLATLGQACAKTEWQVHAFCLMSNHFHLVVETPRANLSAGMRWFLGTYTGRYNRRHRLFGHLFSGRFKGLNVDAASPGYLKTVCDYVHLNPVRAKLIAAGKPVRSYAWSSYPEYLRKPAKRLIWLRAERLLGEWGIGRDDATGRGRFEQGMERRAEEERAKESGDWKKLRRGWCWGPKTFREELLDRIGESRTRAHEGPEIRESEEQKAERLIGGMLRQAGWKEVELEKRAKGDKAKARIAQRLRGETTMTWEWIAKRLRRGYWRTAFNATRAVSKRKRT
jgi:REP element-mobilizing transposase RayT